jgi:Tol biopolymer transport system component/DNA-binding winged helix-turn-helix (wHTH) protein
MPLPQAPEVVRFGPFEFCPGTGELRKNGLRLKLQEQPGRILCLLLENPGELLSREQIQKRLWPDGVFVNYENAINSAVRKLREALLDTSDNPRFIETLPRRGYRFIAPVEVGGEGNDIAAAQILAVGPAATRISRLGWLSLAMTLVLFTAAWSVLAHRPGPPVPYVMSITSNEGLLAEPQLSPDGRQIAYSWDGGTYTDTPPVGLYRMDVPGSGTLLNIYVKPIGSASAIRVTSASGAWPAWSPDGQQIAFWRQSAIYLVSSLGGVERKLADVPGVEGRFSWSVDSRWLAVAQKTDSQAPNGIVLISTAEGQRRWLNTESGQSYDFEARISPNGRRLAYNACSGPVCTLSILELDDDLMPMGPPQRLNAGMLFRSGLAWSSDSKSIIYDRRAAHWNGIVTDRLWRIGTQPDSTPKRLDYTEDGAKAPSISSKGDRLLYAQGTGDYDVWKWQDGKTEKLIGSTKVDESPQYSPDGRKIVFSSSRSGAYEIWGADADGSKQVQLTFSSIASGSPTWSPDGKWIVYDGLDNVGRYNVFVVSPDGGPPRQITKSFTSFRPRFSRDGKWIYFTTRDKGIDRIFRIPFGGGEPELRIEGGSLPCESWDGASLYYVRSAHLYTRALNSARETKVADLEPGIANFAIAHDGIYYFGPPNAAGNLALVSYDPSMRKSRQLASVENNIGLGLSVSVDGSIAYVLHSFNTRADLRLAERFH